MDDELIGQRVLRRYRIVQSLGHGGMGVVYLARTEGAEGFARPVVVKSILPKLLERPEVAEMFVQEARILANLSHPGIVRVLDFGREGLRYFMVLAYVNGYDLGRWRRFLSKTEQEVPINVAVHIVCQVLTALHYAHTARRGDGTSLQTVHRDVSPGNILLSDEGQVQLVDFGIASVVPEFGEKTGQVGFKGKFVYAAPELLQGGKPTPQSDIYAAALVLYQLIAGRNPFSAPTDAEVISRVLQLDLPSLREARPETSAHLEAVLRIALSRAPLQRFESASHFADALRRTQDVPDDQLRHVLAERLKSDFYGWLPEVMGTERLDERDRAWRFAIIPNGAAPQSQDGAPSRSNPATVAHQPQNRPLKLPVLSGKQRRWKQRLTWLAPLAAAAAVAWFLSPDPEAANPPTPDTSEPSPPTPTGSRPAVIAEPVLDKQMSDDGNEPETPLPTSKALKLANTVGDHASLMGDCARRHGLAAEPGDIELSFRLLADGKVSAVALRPEELATTEFGRCVAVGYRAVQFGHQGRVVRFHIPVRLTEVLAAYGWRDLSGRIESR